MIRSPAAIAPAAPEGRRERNKREKRERLLRAARELFARKGFEGATAREICRRARIATGTMFLYARDKRELLLLAFGDDVRRMLQPTRARGRAGRPLVAELAELFGGFLDYYEERPALARSLVEELFVRAHEADAMGALTAELVSAVAAIVDRAQARGEVRADRAAQVIASACFAHYAFWTQAWLVAQLATRAQAEAALREALELQLEGLRPQPTRRTK